ncbi:MAG TPA: hypothetical protein VK390_04290 [Propionibacteriaceae bacterium]|nr:hypothetical protein [Propionibacteriaceae bacterium]
MLQFFDPDTRQLLRVRANALTRDQVLRLLGARRAGHHHARRTSRSPCSAGRPAPG